MEKVVNLLFIETVYLYEKFGIPDEPMKFQWPLIT